MPSYSIIVDCPDSYLDILNIFFIFIEKNWKNRTSKIYITTQEESIDCPSNVEFVKCGDDLNSIERTKVAINKISDDYIFVLDCDDFIFKPIDNNRINDLVTFMEGNNISYLRLWETKNIEQKKYKTSDKHIFYCNKKARYSKSLMANIWRKSEFLKIFKSKQDDGWSIERKWLEEVYFNDKGFYEGYCYCDKNPLNILHAVAKGKWIRKTYKKVIKSGISKDLLSKRGKLDLKANLKYSFGMFLFDYLPSSVFLFFKRLLSPKGKRFVTKY